MRSQKERYSVARNTEINERQNVPSYEELFKGQTSRKYKTTNRLIIT
jgi:hypothetical protein